MRWLRAAWGRLLSVLSPSHGVSEAAAEIEAHVLLHTETHVQRGLASAEARRQALLQLGGIGPVREDIGDRAGVPLIATCLLDLRQAGRIARTAPRLTATIIVMLALGLAASTGLFTVVDALVLRPYPYDGAERLATVGLIQPSGSPKTVSFTTEELLQFQRADVLDGAYTSSRWTMTLTGQEFPEAVPVEYVSANTLTLLGVPALVGRVFADSDAPVGGGPPRVVVLTYQFWQRHFGGNADAIGRALRLDGELYTVIGVVPPPYFVQMDLVVPLHLTFDPGDRQPVTVRVKPGRSIAAAEAALQPLLVVAGASPGCDSPRHCSLRLLRWRSRY